MFIVVLEMLVVLYHSYIYRHTTGKFNASYCYQPCSLVFKNLQADNEITVLLSRLELFNNLFIYSIILHEPSPSPMSDCTCVEVTHRKQVLNLIKELSSGITALGNILPPSACNCPSSFCFHQLQLFSEAKKTL